MASIPSSFEQLQLAPGAVLTLRHAAGLLLQVHAGRVWITRAGSLDDVFVGPGESAALAGTQVVIQCDSAEPARVVLARACTAPRRPLARRLLARRACGAGPAGWPA